MRCLVLERVCPRWQTHGLFQDERCLKIGYEGWHQQNREHTVRTAGEALRQAAQQATSGGSHTGARRERRAVLGNVAVFPSRRPWLGLFDFQNTVLLLLFPRW